MVLATSVLSIPLVHPYLTARAENEIEEAGTNAFNYCVIKILLAEQGGESN